MMSEGVCAVVAILVTPNRRSIEGMEVELYPIVSCRYNYLSGIFGVIVAYARDLTGIIR